MPSELARAISRNRQLILRRDRETLGRLLAAYSDSEERLRPLIALAEQALREAGEEATAGQAMRLDRLQLLQSQLTDEMDRLARLTTAETTAAQGDAIALAQRQTPAVLAAAGASQSAQIAASFVRLPTDAIEALLGIAGNGQPLGNLLAGMGDDAARVFVDELTAGLALGFHPTKVADAVAKAVDVSRNRALLVSRTEILRAYRTAGLENARQNADILSGWVWKAADSGACAACLAMDGTFHSLDESMDSHPACRCVPIYVPKGVDLDLGPTGVERFEAMSDKEQDAVLGAHGGQAFRSGLVELPDFVAMRESTVWGPSISQDSLTNALARAERRGRSVAA